MAACKISDEVSIKDSFDREAYPNHIILTHIVGTVLMLESEALDFTARIERISESEELGACFAPTTDRPQRLIESAARLNTNTRIADLIPTLAPLHCSSEYGGLFSCYASRQANGVKSWKSGYERYRNIGSGR